MIAFLREQTPLQPLTVANGVRSRTHPDGAGRCPRCWLISRACACALLWPLPVRTRFVIVRHVRETSKSTSTARWAGLLVPGCELREYRERADAPSLALGAPGDWLLFPGDSEAGPPRPPPRRFIVLDGTWRQARRMLRALPTLERVPRLTIPPRPQGMRLRAAPNGRALSTLEAMAGAVAHLESVELGAALLEIHDALVGRVLRARGRPGLGRAA